MSERQETPKKEAQQATTEKREQLMRMVVARGLLLPLALVVAIICFAWPTNNHEGASWSRMLIGISAIIGVILLINMVAAFFNFKLPEHMRIERGKRKRTKRRKLLRLVRKLLRKREREEL